MAYFHLGVSETHEFCLSNCYRDNFLGLENKAVLP